MSVRILLEAPITFDVPDGTVHCPMVHATIAGVETKLILDTGTTDHVLTMELVERAGLDAEPSEPGTDLSGEPVPSWSIGDVAVTVADTVLPLGDVVAMRGPGPFEGWGLGGFLSPHNLHPSAAVVLDLAANTLYLAEGDLDAWLRERHPAMRLLRLRREDHGTVAVRASVEPFDAVATQLDTGSFGSEFTRHAVGGLRGAPSVGAGHGAGGTALDGEEIADRTLRVGDATFPIPVMLVREERPGPDGLVGMDVLRGTVLAVRPDGAVLWMVPVLAPVERWTASREDVRALVLVGSHARGEAGPGSDIDIVVVTTDPQRYIDDTSWTSTFGTVERIAIEPYGITTSVRVFYTDGPEVEFGIAPADWATPPVDPGTRRVAEGGMRVLFDRDGHTTKLSHA